MKPLQTVLLVSLVFLVITPIALAQEIPRDFLVEVGKGNIEGHRIITIRSHSHLIDTFQQIVWCLPTDYVFPPAATLMNVSSSDVDDIAGGAGAWNITVFGLDTDWVEQQEVIQMNGQTPVSTTKQYLRINGLHGKDAGATETNEGDIHIGVGATTAGVPKTTYNIICAGEGNSLTGLYSIPVNHTGFLMTGRCGTADNKIVDFKIRYRGTIIGENRMWKNMRHLHVDQQLVYFDALYFRLPIRADVILEAEAASANTRVNFNMKILLIDDDVLHNSTLEWSDGSTGGVVISQPVQVNIVESIDLMTAEFVVFTMIAAILTYLGSTNKVPGDRMMRFGVAFIFWIATLSQWISDGGGFVPMLAMVAPTLMSLIWTIQAMSEVTETPVKKDVYSVYN